MPRDAKRIPGILATLEKVWVAHPDWRLGQLVTNAAAAKRDGYHAAFYMEDEEFIKGLAELERRGL